MSQYRLLMKVLRPVIVFSALFGLLFFLIGAVEYYATIARLDKVEAGDLSDTLDSVADAISRDGKWDINYYREWDNVVPSDYVILAGSDELVDAKGDISDLLRASAGVDSYVPRQPKSFINEIGEAWIMMNRRLSGGNVVGGLIREDAVELKTPEAFLSRELAKYGSTIKAASNLDPTLLKNALTGSVVVSDKGEILANQGAVPLKVEFTIPFNLFDGSYHIFNKGKTTYALMTRKIDSARPSIFLVAFDSLDREDSIRHFLKLNLAVPLGAWLISIIGFGVLTLSRRLRDDRSTKALEISTEQLIAQGENPQIEFKETMRWDIKLQKENSPAIGLPVLKTIAAFLNTNGGTLLIGVADDRTIRGIGQDKFANIDKAQLYLTNLIRDRIGVAFLPSLKIRAEKMQDDLEIIRVDCMRGPAPAYVRSDNNRLSFYVRTGPATQELPVDQIHPYIQRHFEV